MRQRSSLHLASTEASNCRAFLGENSLDEYTLGVHRLNLLESIFRKNTLLQNGMNTQIDPNSTCPIGGCQKILVSTGIFKFVTSASKVIQALPAVFHELWETI